MRNNTIAVVIPCYNGWKYFARCLESLENQTVRPNEIVIVDDCSTDDTYARLQEYAESSCLMIKLIHNEKNVGPSISRKKALLNVSSDYVCFCDCDDWYELDFIETISKKIDEESVDLFVFDMYKVVKDKKIKMNEVECLLNSSKKEILANYSMSLSRMVVLSDILKNISFPELYHGEDSVVALQIIEKSNKIVVLEEAFYNYLYREGSASKTVSPKVAQELIDAYYTKKRLISEEFSLEMEYTGIKDLLYGAVLNACKAKMRSKDIKKIVEDFLSEYPHCLKNPYLKNYSRAKTLFINFAARRRFGFCRFLAKIHSKIT